MFQLTLAGLFAVSRMMSLFGVKTEIGKNHRFSSCSLGDHGGHCGMTKPRQKPSCPELMNLQMQH